LLSHGLGLYISKRIMASLGGTLNVACDPEFKTVVKIAFEAVKIRGDTCVSVQFVTFVAAH
jgi:signal transduction histidine kinase